MQRLIEVVADWEGLDGPVRMGVLAATPARGKEVFSFEYDSAWLASSDRLQLDPALGLLEGPQYPPVKSSNFGLFLDSSPDRWGRVLMRRREAQQARAESRAERRLVESDYLLGVHDGHRMGALRFREEATFLDDQDKLAAPPWTSLRELENACLQLERDGAEADPEYGAWLQMLIAPGGSLGGARPKASVRDERGRLWIAKFPSAKDDVDVGAWEGVLHVLAQRCGIDVPQAKVERYASKQHTFLSRRFDRTDSGARVHFASAMTLLERGDGDDYASGASYIELAGLLIQMGANTSRDLEQLWRRILFSVLTSNTDDHLRNHGFLLSDQGWSLAPAYDMNPDPFGEGLKLNISETDNAQDLDLAASVAPLFRVKLAQQKEILNEVRSEVRKWRDVASEQGLSQSAIRSMDRAFRLA